MHVASAIDGVVLAAASVSAAAKQNILFEFWGLQITGWKIVGYVGVALFSARWFVQLWASRRAGKPVMPTAFWVLSMLGSACCLAYFICGKNDSVGVLNNLFPSVIAAYNLYLEATHRRRTSTYPSSLPTA